jgi:hypothetical protein
VSDLISRGADGRPTVTWIFRELDCEVGMESGKGSCPLAGFGIDFVVFGPSGFTRDVCKVRRLTLLLRVGTLWRCGDGLFSEVPPLVSDAFLTTLHPLIENVLQTVDHFEISCLGAPFSWLEKPRNRLGARSELNWIGGTPLEHLPYIAPRDEKGAPRHEISK